MTSLLTAIPFRESKRCPVCRTKIVVPDSQGLLVKNAILRVSIQTGQASAKCPRCKAWVEVPLKYSE
jgi:uncharacterized protein with PIN domain